MLPGGDESASAFPSKNTPTRKMTVFRIPNPLCALNFKLHQLVHVGRNDPTLYCALLVLHLFVWIPLRGIPASRSQATLAKHLWAPATMTLFDGGSAAGLLPQKHLSDHNQRFPAATPEPA